MTAGPQSKGGRYYTGVIVPVLKYIFEKNKKSAKDAND